MGAIKDFFSYFSSKNKIELNSCCFGSIVEDIYYREVAINSAINLIGKSIANAEFKTYNKNKLEKNDNYYLFNIQPNENQNATEFWTKFVYKLIYDNEVLVIQQNKMFYVADSFDKEEKTLKNSVFYNVVIDDLEMNKRYSSKDVFYSKLNNNNMIKFIENLYSSYGKLIQKGIEDYNKRYGIRGTLKIGTAFSQRFENQETLQNYIKTKFDTYFTAINAVVPLEDGFDFTETSGSNTANSIINIEEIQKGIEGYFDYVAYALNIPKGIIKGNLADASNQMQNFLTFCVDPIAKIIENEINRKYFTKEEYLRGNYLRLDTSGIEHVNIFNIAGSMDVLVRIGFSPNEVRKIVGLETIDEKWANEHYITKNYGKAEGGDTNG